MKKTFKHLIFFMASLGLTACIFNPLNLREGIRSFEVQDYRQAFIRLKPLAEQGQADAEYAVGYMYYYGQGVVEDRQKAVYWIKEAAKQGQSDAKEALVKLNLS